MGKRSYFLTLLLVFQVFVSVAQQLTDYNQIIAPLDSPAVDFKEYLVQLAWLNSPEGAIAAAQMLNAKDAAVNIRKEWMRDIQASFNINEANIRAASDVSGNVFFPRYNMGLNLNLYNILSQGKKNEIGKRDILITEYKINQRKLAIRAETLSRHALYQLAREVLQVRRQVEQESRSNFVLIEQQYRADEKSFDEYSTASTTYFQAQEARLRAENDILLALIQLEEIIGLGWLQVVHPGKPN